MKKYALLKMADMSVRRFEHKDDLKVAISVFTKAGAPYEVYKYNPGAKMFAKQEIYEV